MPDVRVSDQDPEMLAIKAVLAALAPLDSEAAARVLGWAEARYGVEAQRLACERLNTSLLESLKLTMRNLKAVEDGARHLDIHPLTLRAVLNRLGEEVAREAVDHA